MRFQKNCDFVIEWTRKIQHNLFLCQQKNIRIIKSIQNEIEQLRFSKCVHGDYL